jgi:hypothetical protein
MRPHSSWLLLFFALCASAQNAPDMASDAHHQLLLENARVRVFAVSLGPGERSLVRHEHNFLMVTLQDCEIVMWPEGRSDIQIFRLGEGDVRFLFGARARGLRNERTSGYRNITIEFLDPKVTTYGYQRDSGAWDYGDSVLRPPVDPHAKFANSIQLGTAVVTDVQLLPGDSLPHPEKPAAELLIPVSDVDFEMEGGTHLRNSPGEAIWIPAGRKFKLVNAGGDAARFIVVEFPETPSP